MCMPSGAHAQRCACPAMRMPSDAHALVLSSLALSLQSRAQSQASLLPPFPLAGEAISEGEPEGWG